jgi:hypothetical protein
MASVSPSQSEPFTVSYMCHCQWSGPMFDSDAAMPPCAATVCERVGNTLEMQAVRSPCSAMPSVARNPAPPAPTTTTSYSCVSYSYSAMSQSSRVKGQCARWRKRRSQPPRRKGRSCR